RRVMTREVVPVSREQDVLARMWSRRAVLGAGLGGAAALGLAGRARAAQPLLSRPIGQRRPPDLRLLVDRTSHGFTPALHGQAGTRGYDASLEWQLDPAAISDTALDAMLASFPTLAMTARQLQDNYVTPGNQGTVVQELRKATVLRAVYSQRQLF